ncbi:MAG: carbohydrate kinase, partial [Rhizobiales bacterium]|nr:carbohydrate kinase [Hyphomicrobiales bacterium]
VDAADIKAVTTSAIGPCMLPVDADGNALMNGVLYGVDNRAAKEVDDLTARIGEDVLMRECGNALTSQSVGPKILWLKRNRPAIFAKTAKILSSTSFLVHKLTGKWAIDHYTAANFSPLYRLDEGGWSTALADDIVPLDMLPDIYWTTDIVGGITAKASTETGLAIGTPVTCGTIDAASEAISVGVMKHGDMMLMYGSTIFTIMLSGKRITDPRLWYAPWLFEGQHASMAGLATSGTLTHWFRDQFAAELDPEKAFATLASEAASSPPGANGLVLLPYFSGERTPIHDPHAKGVLFGLNLTHTRADMFRAFLEGIALGTNDVVQTYRDIGEPPKALYAVGGGIKNKVWAQAMSDACALPQILKQHTIGASYGNAFLGAVALGDVTPNQIDEWNKLSGEITPNADLADLYAKRFGIFKRLYDSTKDLMAELDE